MTINSNLVPTEYDVESDKLGRYVLIDDRGRRFAAYTLQGAYRKAERAQDPSDPIHHPPYPAPSQHISPNT